jgi:aldose 1-epimerase
MSEGIRQEAFGEAPDGEPAQLITLENAQLSVSITTFGGRIVSLKVPDRSGHRDEVLLGFNDAGAYAGAGGAFGALLGRNANRIADGRLTIDGREYQLLRNDRNSTLHGGPRGFDVVMWKIHAISTAPMPTLVLSYLSPDGDQGFPGELSVKATYSLEGDCLWLRFEAETTKTTVASLSAHPYFNLAGPEADDVLDHRLTIPAEHYLPTNARQIPTGEKLPVEDTPFDFRSSTSLGARIRQNHPQLIYGRGYDHYFILGDGGSGIGLAARVAESVSGRVLEVLTTQPGLQLYTGNKLDGSVVGRGGAYRQSCGFALEPQGFPDAPHHPAFPSTLLRPGELYRQSIAYRFSTLSADTGA